MNRNLIPGTVNTQYGFTIERHRYHSVGYQADKQHGVNHTTYTIMVDNPRLVNLPAIRKQMIRKHPHSKGNLFIADEPITFLRKDREFFHIVVSHN